MTKSEVAEKLVDRLIFIKTPKGTVFDPGSDVVRDCYWNGILLKHIASLVEDKDELCNMVFRGYLKDHWNDSLPPKT